MKTEISSNIALDLVDFNANKKIVDSKTGKTIEVEDKEKINLQKQRRAKQVENFVYVIEETISKLINYAEFKAVQKVALFIATNKEFEKWQTKNYETYLGFNVKFGNQLQKVSITNLDIDNEKQINSRLKAKQ